MNKEQLLEKAAEAYKTVLGKSESLIVRRAMSSFSDEDDQADYVESYLNILQDRWVLLDDFSEEFLRSLPSERPHSIEVLSEISPEFTISSITNDKLGTTYRYIRPSGYINPNQEDNPVELPEFPESLKEKVITTVKNASSDLNLQWVPLVRLAPMFVKAGVDYKTLGYPKLRDMISKLDDILISEKASSTEILVTLKLQEKSNMDTSSESMDNQKAEMPDYILKVVSALSHLSSKHNTIPGGWIDSIYVSPELLKEGIDYKKLGFAKLKLFLQSMPNVVELKRISSTELHVRLKPQNIERVQLSPFSTPYEKLISFAWFPMPKDGIENGITAMIKELRKKALDEDWSLENLQNYFLFTFDRLVYEDSRNTSKKEKKILEGAKYALYNTGLVNSIYYPLFALFKKNTKGRQQWLFSGFHTEFEKILSDVKNSEGWKDLPKPAKFYDSPDDLVFDIESTISAINWEHIIIDNVDRIPLKYIRSYRPQDFLLIDDPENPREYYENLREAIRNDIYSYRKLVELFDSAMKRALNHVSWNYRYAIPMYFPRGKRVDMLIPLVLEDNRDHIVDLVMVLERDQANKIYLANTIMTLKQVFCNIRLVSQNNERDNWFPQVESSAK